MELVLLATGTYKGINMPFAKVELGTGNLLRVTENRESDERGSSTLKAMATAFGLTDQQLDDLFTAASQVKV